MPLKVEWLDVQHSIMVCTGHDTWTWDDYHTALEDIAAQFRAAVDRVDLVIMREKGATMPKGSAMPHYQRAMRIMPASVGLMVMVTDNSFARTIVSIFSRVYPNKDNVKLVMVASLSEAKTRIHQDRLQQAKAA